METALVLMDLQYGVVERFSSDDAYLDAVVATQERAEAAGMPVVVVQHDFGAPRPTPPPVSAGPRMTLAGDAARVHARILPGRGELLVTKSRTSAFAGGGLESVLRPLGITHLVLAGLATSGVVLSTVRDASDRDYRITVLSDLCLDADEEVHRVLTEKVFPRQAAVVASADFWLRWSRATTTGTSPG